MLSHFASRLPLLFVLTVLASTGHGTEADLWTSSSQTDLSRIETRDVRLSLREKDGRWVVRMEAGHQQKWPGVTLCPPQETWDLSDAEYLVAEVANAGSTTVRVGLRADSPETDDLPPATAQITEEIAAGETRQLRLTLERRMPSHLTDKLIGMRGNPGRLNSNKGLDATSVSQVLIFVSQPEESHTLELSRLYASGSYEGNRWLTDSADKLFPMIDRYGQYRHEDWPGKTLSDEDMAKRRQAEDADLAARPGPTDWSQYGGWRAGPQLEATGRFRVQTHGDKWWLVDPTGRLFWSHGIDCVRPTTAYTPITDREFLFAELPSDDSPLARFYGTGSWAPHGYYQDKGRYRTFNFTGSNLYRKYGADWQAEFRDRAHRRLRSWGLNTIGNWSDADVYELERTPFVVTIGSGRRSIEGSSGYWGKFPDPFDPDFVTTTHRNMAARRQAAASSWCLGAFVDNELAWGDETSLAVAALASPAEQPAKLRFVEILRTRYDRINQLNEAWGTAHPSWQSLLESRTPPEQARAAADLESFYSQIAEQYFRVCRQAVKDVVPDGLYLGCRFAWSNDRAIRAASKYCDVIGFNKYANSVADFQLPEGVDVPAIIGEFHFGALDRGMFHTGLRPTDSQQARAEAYRDYVRGALQNRHLVGTHWFQFGDQATTGRGDGENYQIGFLDVCDTPYQETIAACREVAADLYQLRSSP